jgi:signal transduction histidine kinase
VKVKHLHSIELKELAYEKQMEVDEAKLRFFTNISHELRTPLTLIIGPLARIIERENEDKLREQHLLMFRNADRLLKLITRLMDFSKDEQSKLVLQVRKGSIIPTVENDLKQFIIL